MVVSELIEALKSMPPGATTKHLWDGAARTTITHVWLSKSGDVVTSGDKISCHEDKDRPIDAPTHEQDPFWETSITDLEELAYLASSDDDIA